MTTLADTALAPPLRSAAAIRAAEGVHPTYRPDIDGLRAIAVVSVLVSTSFPLRCRAASSGSTSSSSSPAT